MKITMYELLGMVKDGKAPKKIKYKNDIYEYEDYDYFGVNKGYFFDRYNVSKMLNEELEIIEEEKKIPEKLDYCEENTFSIRQTGMTKEDRRLLDSNFKELGNKINSIIDYLKSKGE